MWKVFSSPVGFYLILEAFFLMFFCAWLIKKSGGKTKDALLFIAASLVGSLFFSIPAILYRASKKNANR